ncbi:MAG TPA: MFS transporter [Candidatus Limnocylindrales bacterium]|nr:MFS transporter [Candidatus Limnocylindrales bacterium]
MHRIYTVVAFIVLASLDNVAIGLVPPLYTPIAADLGVSTSRIGFVTAASFLVTAIAAVVWAYYGDRTDRKRLLMAGTLIWSGGMYLSTLSDAYPAFFGAQMLASLGLGAVGSVGFSVVSDLISPRRRGLVMSLWGLSQGVGTLAGTALGGILGAKDWHRPMAVLSVVGVVATIAYLFTQEVRRGQSEPELRALFEAGGEYEHRISAGDLPAIARRRTNIWLVAQGLTAQVVFGSLVWLPQLFQAKAQALGYAESISIVMGSVFAILFQLGGVLSILGGLVGDRVQRRRPGGRALVASAGILTAVPLYIGLFFLPLRIDIPENAGTGAVVGAVLTSVFTEPTIGVSFLVALLALALSSANSPNWFALITEVNPPEHRGTVYSIGNLVNGVGRAAGNGLVGAAFQALSRALPPPVNIATGLAVFQLFFIPTGIMYYLASRTAPRDTTEVRELLDTRSRGERLFTG